MKTLVVKLAGTVEDSSLKKFGEFEFTAKTISASNYNADTSRLRITPIKPVTIEIIGDGYITDEETLTQNLGKKIVVPKDVGTNVNFSNGNYTVKMSSKYDLRVFYVGKGSGTLPQHVLNFDSKQLADMTALHMIAIVGNPCTTIDLSSLQYLTNLKELYVGNNSNRITGNISYLAGMTQLTVLALNWLPKVTGDTSSLAHLHPDNGGVLASFGYEGSGITGSWPPA